MKMCLRRKNGSLIFSIVFGENLGLFGRYLHVIIPCIIKFMSYMSKGKNVRVGTKLN